MNKIYNNLTIKNLIKTDWFNQFNEYQKLEILHGCIGDNVDVFIYANPEYSYGQMMEIRKGLKDNLDVLIYANPENSAKQMMEIRRKLLKQREKLENE